MDVASATWFSEMGMDDYNIFNQFGFTSEHDLLGENNFKQSLSSESHNSSYSTITTNNPSNAASHGLGSAKNNSQASFEIIRPSKQLKFSSITGKQSSQILCFENSNPLTMITKPHHERNLYPEKNNNLEISDMMMKPKREDDHDQYYAPKVIKESNKRSYSSMTRTLSHAQDHIMAERKRREKLSQRFIALSAIVPGLKKMDKASVLGDAIKYLKELKERVSNLEEQTKKRTVESVVLVKKSHLLLSTDDDTSSTNESCDGNPSTEDALPEIEARISDKDVLIRIQCDKQKGLVANIFAEVEKLELSILNSSVLPFGNSTLDITIVARMENDYNMTVKNLLKNLRLALLKIIA